LTIFKYRLKPLVVIVVIFLSLVLFGAVGTVRYQEMLEKNDIRPVKEVIAPRIEGANIYVSLFKEPFELVFFQFADGSQYLITTQQADRIEVPQRQIIDAFKMIGHRVPDLVVVMHNHLLPRGFSVPDNLFYTILKSEGFHGVYGIFYPASKTVLIKTDLGWGK
jgi:hypothetical protein